MRIFSLVLLSSLVSSAPAFAQFEWFYQRAIPGHSIQMMTEGPVTFAKRLELIRSARHSIVMSTYAYKADEAGLELAQELCRAARRNVDVRVVLDGFGSAEVKDFLPNYRTCGIHVVYDGYAHFGPTDKLFVTHDKLLIADGERLVMGGSGIANYYRDYGRASKEWHDLDFYIEGSAACYYHRRFAENWERYRMSSIPKDPFDFGTRRRPDPRLAHPMFGNAPVPTCRESVHGNARVLPLYNNPYYSQNAPMPALLNLVPILRHVPLPGDKQYRPNLDHEIAAIRDSRHEVLLYGAYFVAHDRMLDALLDARKRNVKVTVITNSDASNDDLPSLVTAMYKRVIPLIEAGVDIQLWNVDKQTMHRKGGIFDRKLVFFGSDNMDIRGQNYSSESIAFTDDATTVAEMTKEYLTDLGSTDRISAQDAYDGWKHPQKTKGRGPILRRIGAMLMRPFL